MIGKPVRDVLPEAEWQGLIETFDAVHRSDVPAGQTEVSVVLRSGAADRQLYVNLVCLPLRGHDGNVAGVFVHGVDVTDTVRSRDALRESGCQLRLIMARVRDHTILTLDVDGRVTAWNAAAERMFGYASDEVLGPSAVALFTPEDRAAGRPIVEMGLSADGQLDGAAVNTRYPVRKDGGLSLASGSMEGLRDETGHLRGFVKVVRDITEQKRVEDQRQAMLEGEQAARTSAERAGRMKDEFLATPRHELRTPMNAIIGWSQIIRGGGHDPDDVVEGSEVIERNARA